MFNALLIARHHGLAWALPQLLHRAGFQTDAIASSPLMKKCRFLRQLCLVDETKPLLPAILDHLRNKTYDWIVFTADDVFEEIAQSDLSLDEKLQILPIKKKENMALLNSKIGLSLRLAQENISTPPFAVVQGKAEARSEAAKLKYPLLLKIDSSAGGTGVFEIGRALDFDLLSPAIFQTPLLLQKKIEGVEIDLSSLFLESQLIHFNEARVEKCRRRFGPSYLRRYSPMSCADPAIYCELSRLGQALSCHGFTNIGCIANEKGRFYFEADMRPTAWVEIPRFFGEDPAEKIQKWFSFKEPLLKPLAKKSEQKVSYLIPYFLRLKPEELLFNRYRAWKFVPKDDRKLIFHLLLSHFHNQMFLRIARSLGRRVVPRHFRNFFLIKRLRYFFQI